MNKGTATQFSKDSRGNVVMREVEVEEDKLDEENKTLESMKEFYPEKVKAIQSDLILSILKELPEGYKKYRKTSFPQREGTEYRKSKNIGVGAYISSYNEDYIKGYGSCLSEIKKIINKHLKK